MLPHVVEEKGPDHEDGAQDAKDAADVEKEYREFAGGRRVAGKGPGRGAMGGGYLGHLLARPRGGGQLGEVCLLFATTLQEPLETVA